MYYDERVKPAVDQATAGMAHDDPKRIVIINKCTVEAWKAEDDSIKEIVRKEREQEKAAKEQLKKAGVKSTTPEEFAACVTPVDDKYLD